MKIFVLNREKLRSPLAQRLIVAIVFVSSAITLCLTALQMYGEYRGKLEDIHAVFRQIEEVHLKSLSQSLWAANENDLKLQLEGIVRVPNLEYAAVREGGRLWAQAGQRAFRNTIERQYPMTHEYRGQTLQIGTLTVVAGLDAVYGELLNRGFIVLASNALKTFLVAGFAFAFFHWLVIRHLLSIAEFLRGLELRGPASSLVLARAAGRRPDEIDDVATAINFMHANARSTLAALDASESRLNEAQRNARVGSWCYKADGTIIWSDQMYELFPLPRDVPLTYGAILSVIHPDDLAGSYNNAFMNALNAGATEFEVEYRVVWPDGRVLYVHSLGRFHRDPKGRLIEATGTVQDITERKLAEAALKQTDDHLCLVLDTTPALIHTNRPDGYLDYFNQRWLKYAGLSLEDLQGWAWTATIHPEDVEGIVNSWRASLASGEPFQHEARVRRTDGEYRWMLHHKVALRDEHGNIVKWYGSSIDIEDSKRAEKALRQSEFDLAEAQRVARIGSWNLDTATNAVRWSEELYRVFDVEKTGSRDTYETFLSRVHPDDRTRVSQVNAEARSSGKSFEVEYRIKTRSGQLKHIREVGYASKDLAGAVSGLFGTAQDITERKQAENALRASAVQLQALSRRLMRAEETSRRNINRELHDRIGQNLSALSLNLDLIRSGLTKDSLHAVGARLDAAQKLLEASTAQVRNVMAELHPPALDDYGLFAALRTFAESLSAIVSMNVAVTGEDIVPRLSPVAEMALFRVAQEALTNAAKHSRAMHIEVTLSATREKVTLTISDDGTGIDIGHSGAGQESWGLSIMRERAEAIGAVLRIESGPGQGTRVVVEVAREPA